MDTLFDYNELFNYVFQSERKLFTKMDSYRLIEKKCKDKCLNLTEREQLSLDIRHVFEMLIRIIKDSCPDLTDDDILFCCLKNSRLDSMIAGHCIGCASRQAVNQRKYRIKKKMTDANCKYLFDMIFPPDG